MIDVLYGWTLRHETYSMCETAIFDFGDPYGVFCHFYEIEACESEASRSGALQKYLFFITKIDVPGAGTAMDGKK